MMKDIEIARLAEPKRISEIAQKLGISEDFLEPYGKYKAKITLEPKSNPNSRLILVTATNPTPYGEGKTTVSVGLADAIARLNKKVCLALREPSLGPVFGIKGGAAGGGYAQVIPMEDINLHFTGDFHAITSANNLLSALIDNHIKQGNALNLDKTRIEWRRAIDLNDRSLREIEIALGGEINGVPRKDGFVITAASEIMAILCLAENLDDLKTKLGSITIGYNMDKDPVFARDLGAENAMTILLKEAIYPNLVQTLEGTPALIHGGPFANIAHGCNSIRATKLALSVADYTVTEAGFGADLGAEKFIDIKCRKAELKPSAVVLVTTVRALKHNGGGVLEAGLANLTGHLENLKTKFGVNTVVAINKFFTDTDDEITAVRKAAESVGAVAHIADCFAKGGLGCLELAKEVIKVADSGSDSFSLLYPDTLSPKEKISLIAREIYGASETVFSDEAEAKLKDITAWGFANLPVCIAKTQYSFSDNPELLGRPKGFKFFVRDISLRSGSGFIVAVSGKIMLMPGLSKNPAALGMQIDSK
ncbi:MAG: formate--tetrahydrofolate ligase, partial [Clostridia bacterium]